MVRSDEEIESALDLLGEKWVYNKQSPASHRTVERGASTALHDVLDNSVDTAIVHDCVSDDGEYDDGSLHNLFEFGYTDAVLWYLERETLTEMIDDGYDPVLDDEIPVE